MSNNASDAVFFETPADFYYDYKLTVYDNLFVGIVYGEGLRLSIRDSPLLLQCLSRYALRHRHLYRTLRYLGLYPPVSVIYFIGGWTTQVDSKIGRAHV